MGPAVVVIVVVAAAFVGIKGDVPVCWMAVAAHPKEIRQEVAPAVPPVPTMEVIMAVLFEATRGLERQAAVRKLVSELADYILYIIIK